MIERSTVYCTNCGGDFIQELDVSLNGNHEITCPLCQHIHYRVVRDGQVTEDRYRSSLGGPVYITNTFTVSYPVTFTSTTSTFINASWLNGTDITGGS